MQPVGNSTLCLVCEYDLGMCIADATARHKICPSCGIQYGYSDARRTPEGRSRLYALRREAWVANGRKFFDGEKEKEKELMGLE